MTRPHRQSLTSLPARLVVVALAVVLLGACSDDPADPAAPPVAGTRPGFPASVSDPPSPSPVPSTEVTSSTPSAPTSAPPPVATSDPAPEPDPEPEPEPELIVYGAGGARAPYIVSSLDVGRLRGSPTDFKVFIGESVDKLRKESTCTDGSVGYTVEAVRTDGFALGGVNDCAGYRALWATDQGDWLLVQATQEFWDCSLLELYHVPAEVLLDNRTCFDDASEKLRTYRQS